MFVGLLAGMATAWRMEAFRPVFSASSEPLGVVLAATVMFAVGVLDDLREWSAPAKVSGMVLSGSVLYLLASRELLPTTEVFVTTDHGFHGIFHVKADDPLITRTWFASLRHNLNVSSASILDVTPTMLSTLGIPAAVSQPPFRGRTLVR